MKPSLIVVQVFEWEQMAARADYAKVLEGRLMKQQMEMGDWASVLRQTVFTLRQLERGLARDTLKRAEKRELLEALREAELRIEQAIR